VDIEHPTNNEELRQAIGLLTSDLTKNYFGVEGQAEALNHYIESNNAGFENCLIAKEGGCIIASCLCIDLPGRVSTIMIPTTIIDDSIADIIVTMLKRAIELARNREIHLIQALSRVETQFIGRIYELAGLQYLAQLIYLKGDIKGFRYTNKSPQLLNWRTYSDHTHELFAQVIEGTYENSLDCCLLHERRNIEDIIWSHRSTGRFDPGHWFIGLSNEDPVGVILLSYIEDRHSYEVVYMGVLPKWRRKGYGLALLGQSVLIAEKGGVGNLTITVDSQNKPAQKLYNNFGFQEVDRRNVWIKSPQRTSAI